MINWIRSKMFQLPSIPLSSTRIASVLVLSTTALLKKQLVINEIRVSCLSEEFQTVELAFTVGPRVSLDGPEMCNYPTVNAENVQRLSRADSFVPTLNYPLFL